MNTKTKIINSAIKNFLNLGYEKTSLSLIAEEVGIKKPSIYYHFKNKEKLFTFCISYIMDSLEEKLTASVKGVTSPKLMLECVFTSLLEFNSTLSLIVGNRYDEPINILNLLHLGHNRFPILKKRIDEYYDTLNNIFINLLKMGKKNKQIRSDLDNKALALELIAWIEGLFVLSTIYSSFDINTMRQDLYNNMWKTISIQNEQKNGFLKRKSLSKTISLSTKW